MADDKATPTGEPPMATEVSTPSAKPSTPSATSDAKPPHDPEALEDAPASDPITNARFQNVDLEAGNQAQPAAAQSKNEQSALDKSAFTEFARSLDWGIINLMLAFSSIVVMIAASTICGGSVVLPGDFDDSCSGMQGYQVAVSTISAIIAIVSGALYYTGKLTNNKVIEGIAVFQFLWWVAGVIVLTFFGDFQTVNYANGYFGTWAAFLFATVSLVNVSALFQHHLDASLMSLRSPLLFLGVASAVAMGASISPCAPVEDCKSYNAFAVALSVISLFISLVLLFVAHRLPAKALKGVAVFLVVWWVLGFALVTFSSTFIMPGNGYFASLGAVFASVAFLKVVFNEK